MTQRTTKTAGDPFRRVLGVIDALPSGVRPADGTPLRDVIPGTWPTLGELRALMRSIDGEEARNSEGR